MIKIDGQTKWIYHVMRYGAVICIATKSTSHSQSQDPDNQVFGATDFQAFFCRLFDVSFLLRSFTVPPSPKPDRSSGCCHLSLSLIFPHFSFCVSPFLFPPFPTPQPIRRHTSVPSSFIDQPSTTRPSFDFLSSLTFYHHDWT